MSFSKVKLDDNCSKQKEQVITLYKPRWLPYQLVLFTGALIASLRFFLIARKMIFCGFHRYKIAQGDTININYCAGFEINFPTIYNKP